MEAGVRYTNVDDYIAMQLQDRRETLERVRFAIQKAAPKAEEVLSYGMPAYKYFGIVCYFACFKNHYSFFTRPRVLVHFQKELKAFSTSKGGIQFSFEKPIKTKLITALVKEAVRINLQEAEKKKLALAAKKAAKKKIIKKK